MCFYTAVQTSRTTVVLKLHGHYIILAASVIYSYSEAHISGGTLGQAVLTATSHSYGNGQNVTPHRIQTP